MPLLRFAFAAAVAAAAVGCTPNDTGAVLLYLNARTTGAAAPPTYSSSSAAAATTGDGLVLLTATSNQGVLTLLLAGPLVEGTTVELPADSLHLAVGAGEWANAGGSIIVLSVNRDILRFISVPMDARSGGAVGSFVIDGGGTFP